MDKLWSLFNKYKIKYTEEELKIFGNINIDKINNVIPSETIDKINTYIKLLQPVITIGINKFKLTAFLSKITLDDISYGDFLKSPQGIKAGNRSLPKTFILANILLPIRNQGDTNCCVAFSIACAMEYKNIMNDKYLDYLSPAFIYNKREDNTKDEGMTSKNAIDIIKTYGTATDKLFPMNMLHKPIQPYINDNALNYKIDGSYYITNLDEMKTAIYNNGPVLAILPAYTNYDQNTFWIKPSNNNDFGYHCITIVGYDDLNTKLLIRNSWGTNWAINGYQWFPYSDFNIIAEAWTLLPSTPQPNESVYLTTNINSDNILNTSDQIIGLDPIVFYSLLAGVVIFIIIIIIVIIIRYKQNKK
jgi:hypothetical protein